MNIKSKLSIQTNARAELADCVSMRNSNIHGIGIFADVEIEANTVIQKTHFEHKQYGWINLIPNSKFNHSKINANCKLVQNGDFKELVTLRLIEKDEEILADYNDFPELELPQEGWIE